MLTDLRLAVPVTLGNVVSEAHEIMNCYGTKLTTSIPGLTVQQESVSPTEKPSLAIFLLSPRLNKASGSLLFSLECQRHAYYNYIIEPFSSFFFFAPY